MATEPYLTATELAAITKIARSTWYQWAHEGRVPHLKIFGCLRFRWPDVDAWLQQHSKPGRASRVPTVEVD